MKKLPFLEAVALLVGSVVGAGFLGIPYVVARLGFPAGLLLILGIGLLILIQFLSIAEIALRTPAKHQIAGYVERYLGKGWKRFIYSLVILEGYGVLLAYIVGEGQVLSAIFGGSAWLYSFLFFIAVSAAVYFGIRVVERIDLLLTAAMVAAVVVIAFNSWSAVRFDNFLKVDLNALFPAYGVILFSFLGMVAIPEMRIALSGREKELGRAVAIAALIPIGIYILFTAAVLGVTGMDTAPIATIGLGQHLGRGMMIVGNMLAVITMTTAFLGMALALKETFQYDLRFSRMGAWLFTIVVPIILFSLGLHNFVKILGFVGAFFGGLLGIILVLTLWQAERKGERKPEFVLPHKKFFGTLLILIFALGIVYTVLSM